MISRNLVNSNPNPLGHWVLMQALHVSEFTQLSVFSSYSIQGFPGESCKGRASLKDIYSRGQKF